MTRSRRPLKKSPATPAPRQGMIPDEVSPSTEILLFFRDGAEAAGLAEVQNVLGQRDRVQLENRDDPASNLSGEGISFLAQLGVAFTHAESDQIAYLQSSVSANSAVEAIVDIGNPPLNSEPFVTTTTQPTDPKLLNYLNGYRDAVNNIAGIFGNGIIAQHVGDHNNGEAIEYRDDAQGTWGLHATGVLTSTYTGRGVRVAALVDGLDTSHPDWVGRHVQAKSFVPGELPSEGGASGTHYLGTAFGTAHPSIGPRFACAPQVELFVAKVLSRTGVGSRGAIFAALDWAIANNCRIILVPLGWGGPGFDGAFEMLARRVASRGGLLVSGAGNNAKRPIDFGFVTSPAACPSVVGVGSVDSQLKLPAWTPRGSQPGYSIDLVAPGVNLRSSVSSPQFYNAWSGSSTAAAYVAGIAALWAESQPNAPVHELWKTIVSHARPLAQPESDIGAGLVQAP